MHFTIRGGRGWPVVLPAGFDTGALDESCRFLNALNGPGALLVVTSTSVWSGASELRALTAEVRSLDDARSVPLADWWHDHFALRSSSPSRRPTAVGAAFVADPTLAFALVVCGARRLQRTFEASKRARLSTGEWDVVARATH